MTWLSYQEAQSEEIMIFYEFRLGQVDKQTGEMPDPSVCVDMATEDDSADGVPGCG